MVGAVGGVATTGGCDSFDTAPADGGVEARDAGALADAAGPDGAGPAVDGGDAGPAFKPCDNGTRVFVTSKTYPATFGQTLNPRIAANAACTKLAGEAGLGGRYQAWLGTGFAGSGQRATLPVADGAYVSADCKTVVVRKPSEFAVGALQAPIAQIEDGRRIEALGAAGDVHTVWTGSAADGSSTGFNCSDWTDPNAALPTTGDLMRTDVGWTTGAGGTCASAGRFYCFEVAP